MASPDDFDGEDFPEVEKELVVRNDASDDDDVDEADEEAGSPGPPSASTFSYRYLPL